MYMYYSFCAIWGKLFIYKICVLVFVNVKILSPICNFLPGNQHYITMFKIGKQTRGKQQGEICCKWQGKQSRGKGGGMEKEANEWKQGQEEKMSQGMEGCEMVKEK